MTTTDDVAGVRRGTHHGFDALLVDTPHATAAISVFGGQVLSFVPAGGRDVLWLSPLAAEPPTPIRGGIPLCWPYFGREGQSDDVPSHGYARTARWTLAAGRATDEGVELTMHPVGIESFTPLRLSMTIRVGSSLQTTLHTHNPGAEPMILTEACHNYFRASDAAAVRVEGLAGLTYLDKFDDLRPHEQDGDWRLPPVTPRCDRVYPDAGGRYRLVDPGYGRVIEVTAHGARTAVVWNPGPDAESGMADVGAHWPEFLCVEAANAGPDVVEVAAGATHTMTQTISVRAWSPS